MWPGLALSGILILLFGLFLTLLFGPLGMIFLIAGPVMLVLGLYLQQPQPIQPEDQSKKYCFYCLAEIDIEAKVCPNCGLSCPPSEES